MKVETGVIAVAGSGTRMLPVTRGYPKELLPIINRPAIHLIIEEFIDSGIKRIVLITGKSPDPRHGTYDKSAAPPRGKYSARDEFLDKIPDIKITLEPQVGS